MTVESVIDQVEEEGVGFGGWQCQVDFLKEESDVEDGVSYYDAALAVAAEGESEYFVVECGLGVMGVRRSQDGVLEPVSYLEECLEGDGSLLLFVSPEFRTEFGKFHWDLLEISLQFRQDVNPSNWWLTSKGRELACIAARVSALP